MIASVINNNIRSSQVNIYAFDRVPIERMNHTNPPVSQINLQNNKLQLLQMSYILGWKRIVIFCNNILILGKITSFIS